MPSREKAGKLFGFNGRKRQPVFSSSVVRAFALVVSPASGRGRSNERQRSVHGSLLLCD
jgi:hypothetical protein